MQALGKDGPVRRLAQLATVCATLLLPGSALSADDPQFLVEASSPSQPFPDGRRAFVDVFVLGRTGHTKPLLIYPYFSTSAEPIGPTLQLRIWHRARGRAWIEVAPSEMHGEPALPSASDFLILRERSLFGRRVHLADFPFELELLPGIYEVKAEVCTKIRTYLSKQVELSSAIRDGHGAVDLGALALVPEGCVTSNTVRVGVSESPRGRQK